MKYIELLSLFLMALIAGGWMATMVVFARSYKRMSAAAYIEAEQINSKLACKYFAPTLLVSAILAFTFMVMHGDPSSLPYVLSGASGVLLLVTGIFVKIKVLKVNDTIAAWSRTNPPANWEAVRTKWIRYHNLRTFLGVVAFFLQTSAIIWS